MVRFVAIVAASGAGALAACGPAWAAPEITLAAIATGRLYIVGTTEKPHMPVVLEDKFRTESDDKGKFQYELVYHPARCIVSASIDGKAVEAVVSNCSEQCPVVPVNAALGPAGAATATSLPAMPKPPAGTPSGTGPTRPAQPNRAAIAVPPARTGADIAAEPPTAAPADAPRKVQIEHPPRPPQRPAIRATPPQAKAVQPPKPARKPRPAPREAPDDAGPPIAD